MATLLFIITTLQPNKIINKESTIDYINHDFAQVVSNTATDHPTPTVPVLDLLDSATFDLNKLLSHLPKELKEDVVETHTCTQCNFNSQKQANLVIHIAYVHDQTFFVCDVCETRTKTNDALNFHKRRKHSETKEEGLTDGKSQVLLVESDQQEMDEKLSAEIEVLKTKFFLSKNIEGLENSFIPGEELSTKVVFCKGQIRGQVSLCRA